MTNQTRFRIELLIAVFGTVLIFFPVFPNSTYVGVFLGLPFFYVRNPFHSRDKKDYPEWFKILITVTFVTLATGFLVRSPYLSLAIKVLSQMYIFAFCYLDYCKVFKSDHNR